MSDDEGGLSEGLDVGFKNGSIRLEAIPNVYYAGQTVDGSVIFDLRRPLNFKALYIQFLGEAKVLWTETETFVDHDDEVCREVDYQAREEYFNRTETLAGGFDTTCQLPRTYQNFPFRYQIPFSVPSSFDGDKGEISYTIIATMVYPDNSTEELKKEFKVIAPFDLNTGNPRIKEPIEMEFDEMYSCCFSSEPINIRIRLPFSGYCPGQVIPVSVEVDNESSVEINKMIFTIVSRELYRSRHPPAEFIIPEKELVCVKTPPVLANGKKSMQVDVQVPDMIVPYSESCGIIDIRYFFRVIIKLSGLNDPMQDEAEICLGLVPLIESLDGEYVHPMAHFLPRGPMPVNNGPSEPPMPYVGPIGFTTANTSIGRNQQNIPASSDLPPPYSVDGHYPGSGPNSNTETTSLSDPPPPYPGNPSENNDPDHKTNPYNIGFRMYTPYPSNVTPSGSNTDSLPTSMPLPPLEYLSLAPTAPSAPSAPPTEE